MDGVEFHLGPNDHKVVEDYLARGPEGVGAIRVPAKRARYARGAAEAAQAMGAAVYFEPSTERLVLPGYSMPDLPYHREVPYDIDSLAARASERTRLIDEVIEAHPEFVTAITPPHFFVRDERSANLNVALAADTRSLVDKPTRPVVFLAREYGVRRAAELAADYSRAGIDQVELRISPFGGEDESLRKIQSGFRILDAFRGAGITTTLGWSGNIGQVAVSLGHANSYSVGVAALESVSLATRLSAQRRAYVAAQAGAAMKKQRPAGIRVYLPGIAQTVSRNVAERLLDHTDIRLRLSCRREECARTINGPVVDSRRHYLHARAGDMANLLNQPAAAWRAHAERQRLQEALTLRQRINAHYNDSEPPLPTRTLQSILDVATGEETARTA